MNHQPQVKQFEASVRYRPDIVIIDLAGEINHNAEDALKAAHQEAAKNDPKVILLNFNQVDYINSTGIALIVSLLAQARKSNRHVITYGLSEHYVEIFHITRLSDYLDVLPDEETALAEALVKLEA